LKEIPVRIIEADDRSVMELALVENLQREDLNPVEKLAATRL
jgi:ParB family chromosome partitioning protein